MSQINWLTSIWTRMPRKLPALNICLVTLPLSVNIWRASLFSSPPSLNSTWRKLWSKNALSKFGMKLQRRKRFTTLMPFQRLKENSKKFSRSKRKRMKTSSIWARPLNLPLKSILMCRALEFWTNEPVSSKMNQSLMKHSWLMSAALPSQDWLRLSLLTNCTKICPSRRQRPNTWMRGAQRWARMQQLRQTAYFQLNQLRSALSTCLRMTLTRSTVCQELV